MADRYCRLLLVKPIAPDGEMIDFASRVAAAQKMPPFPSGGVTTHGWKMPDPRATTVGSPRL